MSVRTPIRSEFHVAGMTCRHCALSVSEEVSGIDGVSSVDVELATGAVTVVAVAGDRPRRGRRARCRTPGSRWRAEARVTPRTGLRVTARGGRPAVGCPPCRRPDSRHRAPAVRPEADARIDAALAGDGDLDSYLAALSTADAEHPTELTGRFGSAQVFQLRLPGLRIEQLRRIADGAGRVAGRAGRRLGDRPPRPRGRRVQPATGPCPRARRAHPQAQPPPPRPALLRA